MKKKTYQNLQDRNRLTDLEDELIPPNPPQEGEESGEGVVREFGTECTHCYILNE